MEMHHNKEWLRYQIVIVERYLDILIAQISGYGLP